MFGIERRKNRYAEKGEREGREGVNVLTHGKREREREEGATSELNFSVVRCSERSECTKEGKGRRKCSHGDLPPSFSFSQNRLGFMRRALP